MPPMPKTKIFPKLSPTAIALLFIAAVMLLPFLGMTDFNTKGEPREAIVAQTMLQTDNWVLPSNNGGEFAYKPPLFHWLVALSSLPGGEVTEFTSRLPSALAAFIMAVATFLFFSRRRDETTGFLTVLILLTSFEVHRAAMNCRVDMVLTMFIVLALYLLLRWSERGLKGFPLWAVVMMGCGTLVKGPVAILLPCMVAAVHYLLAHTPWQWSRLVRAVALFALIALASLLLPAVWYYAAYLQGGDKFLYLVYEENVLRFLGKMPYPSHLHGPFYYIPMLLAGMLPWTVLVLQSFFFRQRFRVVSVHAQPSQGESLKPSMLSRLRTWWQRTDSTERYCWLALLLILLFYTIPHSKRGVYILPVYPFLAYFMARFLLWLKDTKPKALKCFEWTLAVLVIIGFLAFILIQSGWITPQLFGERFAEKNGAMITSLRESFADEWIYLVVVISLIGIYYMLQRLPKALTGVFYNVILALMLLDVFVLPPVMSSRSDKPMAQRVEQLASEKPLYAYIDDNSGMMHYFTLNFYAHNTIRNFPTGMQSERFQTTSSALPTDAYLLVGRETMQLFRQAYPQYQCTLVEDFQRRSCDVKQDVQVWRIVLQAAR